MWWQLKWGNPGALLRCTGAHRAALRDTGKRAPLPRGGGSRAAAHGPLLGGVQTRLRRVVGIPGCQLAVWDPVAVRRSGTSIGKGKVGYAYPKSAGWLSSLL